MDIKLIVFVALIGLVMSAPTPPELLSDQEEWEKFKTGFNKSYESPEEENNRFGIFLTNLKNIREHNEKYTKGEVTFTQGINGFADLTSEEFKKRYTGYLGKPPSLDKK